MLMVSGPGPGRAYGRSTGTATHDSWQRVAVESGGVVISSIPDSPAGALIQKYTHTRLNFFNFSSWLGLTGAISSRPRFNFVATCSDAAATKDDQVIIILNTFRKTVRWYPPNQSNWVRSTHHRHQLEPLLRTTLQSSPSFCPHLSLIPQFSSQKSYFL